jgi:hypothetical protein
MDLRERQHAGPRHPWEISRSRFFRRLVGMLQLVDPVRVLDVGAGDGWLAEQLVPSLPGGSSVVCWDVNYSDEDLSAESPPSIRRTRLLPDDCFDIVLMLDVLEHLRDDDRFVRDSVLPRLRTRGTAMISVPVHPWLSTSHDVALVHERRYLVRDIRALLERYFTIILEGSLFTSLLAPRAAQRAMEVLGWRRQSVGLGEWSGGSRTSGVIAGLLDLDNATNLVVARSRLRLPGLSYWALAEHPTSTAG